MAALNRVILFALSIPEMQRFYSRAFDMHPVTESDGWVVLEGGGCEVALHVIPPAWAKDITLETPPRWRADAAMKPVFYVDDLAVTHARLEVLGAQLADPFEVGELRLQDVADPEGNVIQIASAL